MYYVAYVNHTTHTHTPQLATSVVVVVKQQEQAKNIKKNKHVYGPPIIQDGDGNDVTVLP